MKRCANPQDIELSSFDGKAEKRSENNEVPIEIPSPRFKREWNGCNLNQINWSAQKYKNIIDGQDKESIYQMMK